MVNAIKQEPWGFILLTNNTKEFFYKNVYHFIYINLTRFITYLITNLGQHYILSLVVMLSTILAHLSAVGINVVLHIHAHCASALVQDCKLGLVVEESGHL